ncbi:hypothetical protein EUX98_g3639 [Antrodiella citrinella]|uniref:Uncharacterized protein n=1 Tax=Antrodiella citrinella TaxID=2447956 RepID=A0A4S4MX36_9APHY|nr:hypothetical protein EUX98_g3639 [Antrodiella citrinella]
MSSASEKFRQSQPESQLDADQDADLLPPADPTQSGDLPITPALTSAFVTALKDHHIRIRTFTGSWDTFDIQSAGGRYDLVLTSETIYRLESLPSLVRLLHRACVGEAHADPDASLTESASALTLSTSPGNYLCLIAAKLVYFGVGGGVSEFINAVELGESGVSGKVKTIWEQNTGVKRCILKVVWRT